jgi:hypothetical protein
MTPDLRQPAGGWPPNFAALRLEAPILEPDPAHFARRARPRSSLLQAISGWPRYLYLALPVEGQGVLTWVGPLGPALPGWTLVEGLAGLLSTNGASTPLSPLAIEVEMYPPSRPVPANPLLPGLVRPLDLHYYRGQIISSRPLAERLELLAQAIEELGPPPKWLRPPLALDPEPRRLVLVGQAPQNGLPPDQKTLLLRDLRQPYTGTTNFIHHLPRPWPAQRPTT